MNTAIADLSIGEKIAAGRTTEIYRGTYDNQRVIIKLGGADQTARLNHEYQITKDLHILGVVRALGIKEIDGQVALIMQDVNGIPLSEAMARGRLSLITVLRLGIGLAGTLAALHERGIIHKDIKPRNILVDLQTSVANLTDFGVASRLAQESSSGALRQMEGTLAYMSPEQTGRMNRGIDERSDFYTLGVTFYELLTGQLPFQTTDVMELIHSHIARIPTPPHELRADIPQVISDIVMKLLSKTAEGRYQRAEGLRADLQRCLEQLLETDAIAPFQLGQHDNAGTFRLTQKLYGREVESDILLSAFGRVSTGASELMIVTGYSGVGKSALVNDLHTPVAHARGFFLAGKFDQYKRDIPYASVIHAFRDLIQHMMAESDAQIQILKRRLGEALGANGQLIIDVIPEVELLIGPQPPVPPLGPSEAQARFHAALQHFASAFTQPDQPLVLFLDDVQWADAASLTFIELLLTDPASRHLLLIIAYRDNEVGPAHPLQLTLNDIRTAGATVTTITLQPLRLEHVTALLADTLQSDNATVGPLAKLLYTKTDGNPFFLNQFVRMLHEDRLLTFKRDQNRWQWDLAQIRALPVTDNVVAFMADAIRKLPAHSQRIMSLAACIGTQFSLTLVAQIIGQTPAEATAVLRPAIMERLLLPLGDSYQILHDESAAIIAALIASGSTLDVRFAHDRIQQAAYSLLSEQELPKIHLSIGRLMLAQGNIENDDKVFDLVNHMNLGAAQIDAAEERIQLARLDLVAGIKAKLATAYTSAVRYLAAGMELLPADAWDQHYDLTLSLHQERSECAYVIGQVDAAEQFFDTILAHAQTRRDQANVYRTRVVLYTNLGRYTDALTCGLAGLALFGIHFPEQPAELNESVGAAMGESFALRGERSSQDFVALPTMTDPDQQMIIRLLLEMAPPAYNTNQTLFSRIMLEMVNRSLIHGIAPASGYAFTMYGLILLLALGDSSSATAFGQLGITLNERFQTSEFTGKIMVVFGGFISFWATHLRSSMTYLKQAYRDSIEIGDLVYAGFACWALMRHRIASGDTLSDVFQELSHYLAFVEQSKNEAGIAALTTLRQVIVALQGGTANISVLSDGTFDEAAFATQLQDRSLAAVHNMYTIYKTQLLFLAEQYQAALDLASEAQQLLAISAGQHITSEFACYVALTRAALYATANASEQKQLWEQLSASQTQFKGWSDTCPENFLAPYQLISAEIARCANDSEAAMDLYDQAIATAHTHSFVPYEALANELAAKYHLQRGRQKIARAYMDDAYTSYLRWGAVGKARQLAERYPTLIIINRTDDSPEEGVSRTTDRGSLSTTGSGSGRAELLDLMTIMKAAQAIGGEIELDRLLTRLMQIVLENAGAQKGLLVMERNGHLLIEAMMTVAPDKVVVRQSLPIKESSDLSNAVVQCVVRTRETLILQDAMQDGVYSGDPYVTANQSRSILCLPLMHHGRLTGVLYLENNLASGVFTPARSDLLGLLSAQAAVAIENALLYDHVREHNQTLEDRIAQRTEELRRANDKLEQELNERQQAQEAQERLQNEIITMQQAIMKDLSSPLIPITDQIMVMPLIGSMDTQRAQQVLETLLHGVMQHRTHVVIIDITGVPLVDTSVAGALIRAAQAVQLLGAQIMISGIRPEVAQTLVGLGVDLSMIVTRSTLQSAVTQAMSQSNGTQYRNKVQDR